MANRGIVRLQSRSPKRVETGNALNVALQDIKLNMSCVMLLNILGVVLKCNPRFRPQLREKEKIYDG